MATMYTGIRAYVNNLRNKFRISNYSGGNIKEDEMSVACSMHGRDEKCIQNFDQKTRKKETSRKICASESKRKPETIKNDKSTSTPKRRWR